MLSLEAASIALKAYPISDRRADELAIWLHRDNWHRPTAVKIADTNQQTRPKEQPVETKHLERPQEIQKILLLVSL